MVAGSGVGGGYYWETAMHHLLPLCQVSHSSLAGGSVGAAGLRLPCSPENFPGLKGVVLHTLGETATVITWYGSMKGHLHCLKPMVGNLLQNPPWKRPSLDFTWDHIFAQCFVIPSHNSLSLNHLLVSHMHLDLCLRLCFWQHQPKTLPILFFFHPLSLSLTWFASLYCWQNWVTQSHLSALSKIILLLGNKPSVLTLESL